MSKKNYPDSLELLLDTICNTFGSIILIAISLVVFVIISKNTVSRESWDEHMIASLESDIKAVDAEKIEIVNLIKKITTRNDVNPDSNAYEQAQNHLLLLESEIQEITYSNSVQDIKNEELSSELEKLILENSEQEANLLALIDDRERNIKDLEKEKNQLEITIESLKDELDRVPHKNIHFANNVRTNKTPFWLIIETDTLFRLGDYSGVGTSEVRTSKVGDTTYLYPQNGVSISGNLSAQEVSSLLSTADKNTFFLSCFVNPDSLDSFVSFRRQLRSLNYQVHWVVRPSYKLYSALNPVFDASF